MPQTITNITRCHPHNLAGPKFWCHLANSLSRKNVSFGFKRLWAPSQSQKGHFHEKKNTLNDTKTSELSKSAECNGEYLWSSVAFVEAWIKSKYSNGKTGLKTTQMLHKNIAWCTGLYLPQEVVKREDSACRVVVALCVDVVARTSRHLPFRPVLRLEVIAKQVNFAEI